MQALLARLAKPHDRSPGAFVPTAVRGQVLREAVVERIVQAVSSRLVLVCAPAGFGKTTVLEQSRERLGEWGERSAWLTLDAQDNDRSRFLGRLAAALVQLQQGPQAVGEPEPLPLGAWALALMERYARLEAPFVLFLDDFEHVHDAGVLALVGELLERLPRGGRLVVGSRSRPCLALARLRTRGQLVEIDAEHLRFSFDDTCRFFAGSPVALPMALLRRLHDKSEGWVAALWLASLALERPHAGVALIEGFSGSHLALAEYLAEDVLARLAGHTRRFLLFTSVLRQFDPAICQALCDEHLPGTDAAAMIDRLAADNLFLTPIRSESGHYRYHALFAVFLRGQLAREQPGASAALHLSAARWYEARQRPVPAIDHALEGGDPGTALRLLQAHAMPLLMQGRLRLLARWCAALPAHALRAHPLLHAIGLWALCLTAGPVEAMKRLSGSGLHDCGDPVVRGLVDALPPTLAAMLDRQDEAYALGSPLLARLSAAGRGASFADSVLVNVVANAATALGRHQEARRLLDAGRRAQGHAPTPFSLMYAESTDGIIDLLEGRLRQASARFRLAVQPGDGSAPAAGHAGGNAWAGLLHAATVYERGELEEAGQMLNVYLPLVCDAGLPDHMILGHVMLARIAVGRSDARADHDTALKVLGELEALGHRRGLARVVASARLERARMAMHQGDRRGAETELMRAEGEGLWERVARQCPLANDLESPALSRLRQALLLGDGQAAAAVLPHIAHQIAVATATASHRRMLLLRLLEAMATLRSGRAAAALRQFRRVLEVCAREGFVRLLVDEGLPAGELLQRLLAQDEELLRADPLLADHARSVRQQFGPLPELVDRPVPAQQRLTAQEIKVLRGVAEGLSNDQVADRQGVSRNTIRTHLRNISAKLGAANRTQAVSLARRMGWLE